MKNLMISAALVFTSATAMAESNCTQAINEVLAKHAPKSGKVTISGLYTKKSS